MAAATAVRDPGTSADLSPCHGHGSESSDEDSVCAICFEHRPFVNLPCACRINYCATCWDRALATSVTVRGRAQCPSCRSGFRIDFNQDAACLVFSKEEKTTMTVADWRSRLYGKARPVQIRLLKDFGTGVKAASSSAEASDGAVEVTPLRKSRIISLGEEPPALSSSQPPAPPSSCEPLCVCGAVLENIDSRTRIIRMLEDTEPGWRSRVLEAERLIDSLASSALITCDLCEDIATRSGGVWTCKNGPHTVLHPAAYDVCESCFAHYADCGNAKQQICDVARPPQVCWHGRANRCCQNCTSFMSSLHRRRTPRSVTASSGVVHGPLDAADVSTGSSRRETTGAESSPAAGNSTGSSGIVRSREWRMQARWRRSLLSRLLGMA